MGQEARAPLYLLVCLLRCFCFSDVVLLAVFCSMGFGLTVDFSCESCRVLPGCTLCFQERVLDWLDWR